jgi:hypothetical protein
MRILRILALPFQLTGLLFIGISALLQWVLFAFGSLLPVLVAVGTYVLLSWLNKYAFAILEHTANGTRVMPVASAEMLDPFSDWRSWVHPLLALALWWAVRSNPDLSVPIIGLAVAIAPASISSLAMSYNLLEALNPLSWWRVLHGLGGYYLLLVLAGAIAAGLDYGLVRLPLWRPVQYAGMGLVALCLYALVGGVLHERRLQLGFEPRHSPERVAERLDTERLARRQQMIDAVYAPVRVADYTRAALPLQHWFANVDQKYLAGDIDAVIAQCAVWPERRGFATVARTLISHLLLDRKPTLAVDIADLMLQQFPDFALGTEAETIALAESAKLTGRRRLAILILDSLQRATPGSQPSEAAQALRRELAH